MRSFPVRDNCGYLLGRGVLLDDITLERSVAESRSETLAMAAHELRTPLAIIKGCATTLLGGSARWEPTIQREMLQMIDSQSDRLYDVLNTLLDVWRFDAGTQPLRLAQIQLSELLLQTVKRWQNQALDFQFILDLPPDIPPVVCDALRIEQVLNHVLNNAVVYSPTNKIIRLQLEANESEARINITDEGIGIASEHLDRIFERFYRVQLDDKVTANAANHSGLGLAAARATIEAHNGKIWADSPGPSQGSTFFFTIPFTSRTSTQAQPLPALTDHSSASQGNTRSFSLKQDRRIRILVAENDARLARYVRANLEEQQYRVQMVTHGLQLLRQIDLEEPDILVISTHLADMSGIELLQRVREFSHTPVVMLCDDCHEDERVQFFDLGCDDLLVKPFGIKEMLSRVRALLRRQVSPTERAVKPSIFVTGDLQIDYAQHLVTVHDKPVQLSRTEYKLLSVLAQNAGMVMTHELLLERVWGPEYNRDVDFIWVYISRLRRKIEADSRSPKYILTVPEVGYKLAKL
jgi:DNA-binding response OmpR family regulator